MQMHAYYITASNEGNRAELVGPFKREADAEAMLELTIEEMHARHPEQSKSAQFKVERVEFTSLNQFRQGGKNKTMGVNANFTGWCSQ